MSDSLTIHIIIFSQKKAYENSYIFNKWKMLRIVVFIIGCEISEKKKKKQKRCFIRRIKNKNFNKYK